MKLLIFSYLLIFLPSMSFASVHFDQSEIVITDGPTDRDATNLSETLKVGFNPLNGIKTVTITTFMPHMSINCRNSESNLPLKCTIVRLGVWRYGDHRYNFVCPNPGEEYQDCVYQIFTNPEKYFSIQKPTPEGLLQNRLLIYSTLNKEVELSMGISMTPAGKLHYESFILNVKEK